MGKPEGEQSVPASVDSRNSEQNAENRCRVRGLVRFKCFLALVMGVAVLLSAIFWLPPFFQYGDQKDLDLNSQFRDHDIVARFMVEKPISFLEDNILPLEDDIFSEIDLPTIKVKILSLEPSVESNITKIVFAVDPEVKDSEISSTIQSLIKASFATLVIRQSSLRLTESLFGDTFSFEVLKFPGGITIIPPQSAFLLQKVQIFFNFTLNFSISQVQDNFDELTSQLKSGLHLAAFENLYITLANSKGSTVAPPCIVQTSVLLAIRNNPRLRQLAQTITGSHSKNLGLNNTIFGRVKQVHLSSILQHSLSDDGSPTPAPSPHPHNYHHYHHHHDVHVGPAIAPVPATKKGSPVSAPVSVSAPAPAPVPAALKSHGAKPPGCHFGYRRKSPKKTGKQSHLVPPVAPPVSAWGTAPSPRKQVDPPIPVSHPVPASSPLPNVVFSHVQPPSKSEFDAKSPDVASSVSPSPTSSSAGRLRTVSWAVPLFLALALHF